MIDAIDSVANSLAHDSRALSDRSPFGAVMAGTTIDFAIESAPGVGRIALVVEKRHLEGNQVHVGYAEIVRVPMRRNAGDPVTTTLRWSARHRFDAVGIYGYWFEVRIAGVDYVYQNNKESVFWTHAAAGGRPRPRPGASRDQQRAPLSPDGLRPDFQVPDWAGDVVYYYIFPDRFRNGDPTNDPTPGIDSYQRSPSSSTTTGTTSPANRHRRWLRSALQQRFLRRRHRRHHRKARLHRRPRRQHAVHHAAVHRVEQPQVRHRRLPQHRSRISAATTTSRRLTAEAAKRGIRVIPDTSLNHTGSDSLYFDRFGKYEGSAPSRVAGSAPIRRTPAGTASTRSQADPDKQYHGWTGVSDLPELNKSSPGYRQFAYGADDSVMQLWLDRGAAGWRMDVAPWVPDDFWREWRTAIKAHRPDALTIAETWFDASQVLAGRHVRLDDELHLPQCGARLRGRRRRASDSTPTSS